MSFQLIAAALADAGLATSANQSSQITAAGKANSLLDGSLAGALLANPGLTVSQELAALIASGSATGTPGGTPLLHGADQLLSNSYALAAGATVFSAQTPVAKPGYLASARPTYTAANGTIPFVQLDVRWLNATGSTQIAFQRWIIPVHPNGGAVPVLGKGPTQGPVVQFRMTNLDTGQPVTFTVDLWETTQHIARDDWRDADVFPPWSAAPGYTAPTGAAPATNVLAAGTFTVNAGQTSVYLLPLYAGQAFISAVSSAVTGANLTVKVDPLAANGVNSGAAHVFFENPAAAGLSVLSQPITMPRIPCVLTIANTGTAPITIALYLAAMEYAS